MKNFSAKNFDDKIDSENENFDKNFIEKLGIVEIKILTLSYDSKTSLRTERLKARDSRWFSKKPGESIANLKRLQLLDKEVKKLRQSHRQILMLPQRILELDKALVERHTRIKEEIGKKMKFQREEKVHDLSQQEERPKRFVLNLQQTRVEIGRLTTELEIFRNKRHLL